jgi:hypothetical protein
MTISPVELEGPRPRTDQALRRALAVATAVVFVVGMVGLATIKQSRRPSGSALAAVLGAASKTSGISTAKVSMTGETAIAGTSARIPSLTLEGAMQFAPDTRATATVRLGGLSFETLAVGRTLYVKVPDAGRRAGRIATPWVSVDQAPGTEGALGSLAGPVLPGGGDPMATLREIQANGLVKSATEGDRRSVRGVSTTVFHVLVDGDKFKQLAAGQAEGNPQAAMLLAQSVKMADPTIDLYVDGDGLVRRQVVSAGMSFSGGERRVTATFTYTLDLYDFGTPVVVNPPPPDQVTHLGSQVELQRVFAGTG